MTEASKVLELGRGASLPERTAIPAEYKWKLDDIYGSQKAWEEDFAKIKSGLPKIAAYKGTLAQSPQKLAEFLKVREELSIILGKLYVFANMKSHEDTADSSCQGPANRAAALSVEFSAAESYMTPEILSMPEETLKKYISAPELAEYSFLLREILRQKQHVLSEAEELILARSGDMAGVPDNAFSMLTNADMKFPSIRDENGNKVEMSEERAVSYLRSPKRHVRRAAFSSLYKPYEDMKNTLGATFDGMLKASRFYSASRNYGSPLEEALDANNIPVSVYDSLVDTLEGNLEPMYRYMALRKKMLGVRSLHMYDLYVPLARDPFGEISWSDAQKMMFDGLAPLGADYLAQVRTGLSEGWADVFPNRGKRSGAYSWGSYGTHPYIFLNHTNNLNDVMTLVHEMGHSMHSWYSRRSQPFATADYCIFTAEVASTTNEVIFLSGLIAETKDKNRRLYLLNRRLENIRTTVYRQTMFASFEREVHKRAADGGDTTPDGLKQLWYELNRKYYGGMITIDEQLKMEWARIPHFYSPFYVYQYATGFSAATALASGILEHGAPARDRYLNFLTKGGSDYPIELLKGAGVDMSTQEPVKAVIKQFGETLDEIESLL